MGGGERGGTCTLALTLKAGVWTANRTGKACCSWRGACSQTVPGAPGSSLRGAGVGLLNLYLDFRNSGNHLDAGIKEYFGQSNGLINFGRKWFQKQLMKS